MVLTLGTNEVTTIVTVSNNLSFESSYVVLVYASIRSNIDSIELDGVSICLFYSLFDDSFHGIGYFCFHIFNLMLPEFCHAGGFIFQIFNFFCDAANEFIELFF